MLDAASTIAGPRRAMAAIDSPSCGMVAGDSPSNGSSSRSSAGSSASARAIESILRSPPESCVPPRVAKPRSRGKRSEEHTSELQSPCNLVCRLLLEKKKDIANGLDTADCALASQSAHHSVRESHGR